MSSDALSDVLGRSAPASPRSDDVSLNLPADINEPLMSSKPCATRSCPPRRSRLGRFPPGARRRDAPHAAANAPRRVAPERRRGRDRRRRRRCTSRRGASQRHGERYSRGESHLRHVARAQQGDAASRGRFVGLLQSLRSARVLQPASAAQLERPPTHAQPVRRWLRVSGILQSGRRRGGDARLVAALPRASRRRASRQTVERSRRRHRDGRYPRGGPLLRGGRAPRHRR